MSMTGMDLFIEKRALFSKCGVYRYDLVRNWDESKPLFLIIMLNPSTADDEKDDPTTTKCLRYARENGCGSYVAVNLFAYRSPYPKDMLKAKEPIGKDAQAHIDGWLLKASVTLGSIVVTAWGNNGNYKSRDKHLMESIRHFGIKPLCFGVNKNGSPKHPTYLAHGLPLVAYEGEWAS